ncbi:hypothetical protein Kompost2_00006 [Pseudomonas phage vB_PpuP-Kompost-2]
MGLKTAQFWNIDNVAKFNGYDVTNGEIDMSKDEYIAYLDDCYDEVTICGMKYSAGSALEAIDPVAFRCGQGDVESSIQSDLEYQLDHEDDSGIEWIDDELLDDDEDDQE